MADIQKEIDWLLKEKYHGITSEDFEADVLRLKAGEPLAYIIGSIPFYDCVIDLSYHPLIPRPETEFMIERAVKELSQLNKESLRLADVFSGSGAIGVALLKHLPSATVDFSDIDLSLLTQIELNIAKNDINVSRTSVEKADALSSLTGTYDAIFANPPYIDPAKLATMEKSVTLHEPHLALFAGEGGLDYLKLIIRDGGNFLNEGGAFYIECDPEQKAPLEQLLETMSWKYEFWPDQYGVTRFLVLHK